MTLDQIQRSGEAKFTGIALLDPIKQDMLLRVSFLRRGYSDNDWRFLG